MTCEINVVVSKSFCCDKRTVNIQCLYRLSDTFGYIEFLRIDLRASYKKDTAKIEFFVVERFQNKRLPPVMSGHLFGCRSDTCECMDTSVEYLQRRSHNRNISKVYVWLCAKYANRLHRKNQVVMHCSLSHDLFYDNDFLLTRMSEMFKLFCIYNKRVVHFL